MSGLQIGDAEVVRRKTAEVVGILQPFEHLCGVVRLPLGEVYVRAQELNVVADPLGNLALDPIERPQRVGDLILLKVNAREPVRRVVANSFVDSPFEHGFDSSPCTVVHPVAKLEIAQGELRVIDVIIECVELGLVEVIVLLDLGVEPLERIEELSLVRVIQRLAEVQILQFVTMTWTRRQTGEQQEPDP